MSINKNIKPKLSIFEAIVWILSITFIVSGGAAFLVYYYKLQAKVKLSDDNYRIIALVQACPTKERIQCIHLSEILDLSVDQPKNLYSFSIEKGLDRLKKYSLIKEANIKKVNPGTLFVEYELREPIAYFGNFANTTFDSEGIIFPFEPFFSPKKLPTLYLDKEQIKNNPFGKKIDQNSLKIFNGIKSLESESLAIEKVDLSKRSIKNAGQREVVVELVLKKSGHPLLVRINSKKIEEKLDILKSIIPLLKGDEKIIDLRLDSLLYIKRI